MTPRPIFRLLALPVLIFLPITLAWLWFTFAAEPKPYYLSFRSGLLYERLLLPPLPRFPGSVRTPEHHTVLVIVCPPPEVNRFCYATPESFRAHIPAFELDREISRGTLRADLDRLVYHGSALDSLFGWVIIPSIILNLLVLVTALILDWRRERRLLEGIQIAGRWPTAIERFSGFWGGWRKRNVLIDVKPVKDEKIAPL